MQIRDFGSKMQQLARKTAPDWKTKYIRKKNRKNTQKDNRPIMPIKNDDVP